MPPRLFLCSALVCLQEGMGVCCNTLALLLYKQLLSSFSCYYVLLNLLVREFPRFVGKQAAQVSSDQEPGNGGTMLVLPPIFVSECRRALNLTCFQICRVQGHCYLLNLPLCAGHAVGSSQPSHFVKKQDPESLSCLDTSVQSSRLVGRHFKSVQTGI